MTSRQRLGSLAIAAVVAFAATGCKDNGSGRAPGPTALGPRCLRLGKVCGSEAKHVDKIVDECDAVAAKQVEKGCVESVSAQYECYEKELCGKDDKIWAFNDLSVLAKRRDKCAAEIKAAQRCEQGAGGR